MDSDLPLNVLKSGAAGRKRPFSVVNSSMSSGFSNESSEDYNILSSLGMKDRDIFKSPDNSMLVKMDDSMENFKVPMNTVGGQSPYFNMSTPKKPMSVKDPQPKAEPSQEVKKTTNNNLMTQKEQLSSAKKAKPEPKHQDTTDFGMQPRKLRSVGEYTVGSMDKEYQELMDYLKQEREKDQLDFVKCSKTLRDRVSNIAVSFCIMNLLHFSCID